MWYVFVYKNHFKKIQLCSFLKTLLIPIFFFVTGCGGPPQFIDEGSETPAMLAVTSDTVLDYPDSINGFSYPVTITIENLSTTVPNKCGSPAKGISPRPLGSTNTNCSCRWLL